jgi:hypothetical protein
MSTRIIQVRPSSDSRWQKQGGWEVYEGDGVSPLYCGEMAREHALEYDASGRIRTDRNTSARR